MGCLTRAYGPLEITVWPISTCRAGREGVRFHDPENQPISRDHHNLRSHDNRQRHLSKPLPRPAEAEVQSRQDECRKCDQLNSL
jgi:hypothetical protein